MKIIFLALIVVSTYAFPQSSGNQNLLALQNSIKEIKTEKSFSQSTFVPNEGSKKSVGLAILFSTLLPGMGELYADSYSSGKYFTIAEGTLWGVYFGMNTYSGWLKNQYISYATSTGGVNTQNKGADYYATIGDYSNLDEYNNAMALQGSFNQMWSSSYYWNWKTETERRAYRNLWSSSEQARNNLRFVVGAMILNRIISVINAARLTAAYNKKQSSEVGWNVSVGMNNVQTLPTGLQFNFQTEL